MIIINDTILGSIGKELEIVNTIVERVDIAHNVSDMDFLLCAVSRLSLAVQTYNIYLKGLKNDNKSSN